MIRNISYYFADSRLNLNVAEFMKIRGESFLERKQAKKSHLSEAYLFWRPIRSGGWISCQPPDGLTLSQIPIAPALMSF